MCGIIGAIDLRGQRTFPEERLLQMTGALAHRGPDDEQIHVEPGLALGVRRLAIIDFPPRANSAVPDGVPPNRGGHGVPPEVVSQEVGAALTQVATVIPGMRRVRHVHSNAAVSDGRQLSPELLARLAEHAWDKNWYSPD